MDLSAREFALLGFLIRHAGQVLTRQQILDAVWGAEPDVYSNVVDLYIHYLRRKLGELGRADRLRTVRGRLHAALRRLIDGQPDRPAARDHEAADLRDDARAALPAGGRDRGGHGVRRPPGARCRRRSGAAVVGDCGGRRARRRAPRTRNESESDESLPAAADTFLLVLDWSGLGGVEPVPDPPRRPAGDDGLLPATGEDLRTVTADALSVRLLTMPVVHDHAVVATCRAVSSSISTTASRPAW